MPVESRGAGVQRRWRRRLRFPHVVRLLVDRRLHDVVGRDVVVTRHGQAGRLHGYPKRNGRFSRGNNMLKLA